MAVVEHIITGYDTLQSIALYYTGSASAWKTIADFNHLDYPYIVSEDTFSAKTKASGYLTVTKRVTDVPMIIKKGSLFSTLSKPAELNSLIKYYEVATDQSIPAGVSTADIWVIATSEGELGNVGQRAITQAVSSELQDSLSAIFNNQAFTGGKIYNVKHIGDTLLIPTNLDSSEIDKFSTTEEYLRELGGIDLALDAEGELTFDTYGDLTDSVGLANIKQAITHRLTSEAGELPWHEEYGTYLSELVGKAQPYIPKLMELRILDALQYEDRIESASILSISQEATSIYVTLEIKLLNGSKTEIMDLRIPK